MQQHKVQRLSNKFAVTIICLIGLYFTAAAQDCKPDAGFWNDYSGKLGTQEIQLSYFTNNNGTVTGNYRFIKNENIVYSFLGKQNGCNFSLTVYNNNNESAGTFSFGKTPDNFDGDYRDADGNLSAVKLRQQSAVGGSLTQRYFELFGTTDEVDSFAAKVKTAVANNDVQWLASNCNYPLSIYAGGHRPNMISNKKEFFAAYKKFFTPKFKSKFALMKCYNMFSNHMGAGMGKGEAWINNMPGSTAASYSYGISSFNIF